MKHLTVFFDEECGLCCRFRHWLERQPAYVPVHFVAYQSAQAKEVFPDIDDYDPEEEILCLGSEGSLYRGGDAWIICLWATRTHRETALTMASPAIRPLARRVALAVAEGRRGLSRLLRLHPDGTKETIKDRLGPDPIRCHPPSGQSG